MNHFGLDIGSGWVKIAQVVSKDNGFLLTAAGMSALAPNVVFSDSEKDLVAIAGIIKSLKKETKITASEVIAALPERSVYTQVFEIPKMNEDELSQAIPWEAENLIPRPLSELNLDWEIINDEESQKKGKIRVLLVASPTDLINKYLRVIKLADLVPVALESELLATTRALQFLLNNRNVLVVNLGIKSTDLAVVKRGNLYITRTIPTAGEAISRAIASSLGLELAVAEEYKKAYGLSPQAEGKVALVMGPILTVILTEIKKAIFYYNEREKEPIQQVILSGGGCLIPGISEYFTKGLGLEVQIADPFSSLIVEEKFRLSLKRNSPLFTIAVGLAEREK